MNVPFDSRGKISEDLLLMLEIERQAFPSFTEMELDVEVRHRGLGAIRELPVPEIEDKLAIDPFYTVRDAIEGSPRYERIFR